MYIKMKQKFIWLAFWAPYWISWKRTTCYTFVVVVTLKVRSSSEILQMWQKVKKIFWINVLRWILIILYILEVGHWCWVADDSRANDLLFCGTKGHNGIVYNMFGRVTSMSKSVWTYDAQGLSYTELFVVVCVFLRHKLCQVEKSNIASKMATKEK